MDQKKRRNPWVVAIIALTVILVAGSVVNNLYVDAGLERAQVSEAVLLLDAARAPLSEYFQDRKKWPARAADALGNTSGKYTRSIEITTGAGGVGEIELTATMHFSGVKEAIAGVTVHQRSADGRTWTCRRGTAPAKYLPKACQN